MTLDPRIGFGSFPRYYSSWDLGDPRGDRTVYQVSPQREVKIRADADPTRLVVRLSTNYPHIEPLEIRAPQSPEELYYYMRRYATMIAEKYGCVVSVTRPNLYSAFQELRPQPVVRFLCTGCRSEIFEGERIVQGTGGIPGTFHEKCYRKVADPPEPDYEVNMVEALVGWKGLKIRKVVKAGVDYGELLSSQHDNSAWIPEQALEAKCSTKDCPGKIPNEKHSCGIYAVDKPKQCGGYGDILLEVYGWGRYVRGDAGWRAQWAYPKAFHLKMGQEDLIDKLKVYRVPIFVQQPLRIYDPSEDGYGEEEDNEHRDHQADGDCRTFTDPGPEEA